MGGDKNVEEKDRQRNRRGSDALTMTSKSGHAEKHTRLDASAFASNQLILLEKERLSEVAEMSNAITTYSPSQLQPRPSQLGHRIGSHRLRRKDVSLDI